MKKVFTFIILLMYGTVPAIADTVSRIDVRGNKRMDAESVRLLTGVKIGDNVGKGFRMWGYVIVSVGIVFFLLDIYFVYISLGFRKNKCKKCKGYLVNTIQHKNTMLEEKPEDSISIIWIMYMCIV